MGRRTSSIGALGVGALGGGALGVIISGCSLLIQPTTFGGGDAGMDAGAADASVADAGPTDAAGNDGGGGCVPACGEGFECVSMRCVPSSCARDEECDDLDECTVNTCRDGRCEVDLTARDGEACDGGTGVCAAGACVECVSDAQCPGRRCDTAANECVDCLEAADCTGDPGHFCRGFVCSATRACVLDDSVRDGTACAGGTEVCSGGACAAPGTTRWARRFAEFAQAARVAVDAARNVYIAGFVGGMVDFGGGVDSSRGGTDAFLASYDAEGRYRWSRTFGWTDDDWAHGVAVDAAGNVYVTGIFVGPVDFGGGVLTSAADGDIFLASYTSDGAHRWSHNFGAPVGVNEQPGVEALVVDRASNVFLAGSFQGSIDFGGGSIVTAGVSDVFVASFTSSGMHRWSRAYGGAAYDGAMDLALDPANGHLLVCGIFQGEVTLGATTLTSGGGFDGFVLSLTAGGEPRWARRLGGGASDNAQAVAVDAVGRVYVTGFFQGDADLEFGTTSAVGGTDIFVVSYNAEGVHRWTRTYGGAEGEVSWAIEADDAGHVYLVADYTTPITVGGPALPADASTFVASYTSTGMHRWSRGVRLGQGLALAADSGGHLYVVGIAASDADLGVTPMGTGRGVLLSIVR